MTEQREGSEYFMSGANAMALGMCFMDNPYYKQDAMPRATGESVEQWNRKAEAWNAGWAVEDIVRAGQSAAAAVKP